MDGTSLGLSLGSRDGSELGDDEGKLLGSKLGEAEGTALGRTEGIRLGPADGKLLGSKLGVVDGELLGPADGDLLGPFDGDADGVLLGLTDGKLVGELDGLVDGERLGLAEGVLVGGDVSAATTGAGVGSKIGFCWENFWPGGILLITAGSVGIGWSGWFGTRRPLLITSWPVSASPFTVASYCITKASPLFRPTGMT